MIGYIKKHRELFILLLLLLILVIIPLSFLRLPSGHDYKYHMGRIYQISENIRHGKWFAPIYYEQLSGCGYASPIFYGDVFLHLPGALVTLGMSVEASLRIYIMLCLTATALVTYFCALKLTSEKLPALVTSVLYTFSSYLAIDFITRVALGEVQAFIFLPIAFTGLMSILTGDAKHWLLLPTGLCGVLISHTLSAACLAFFFLVIALFYIPELIKNKKRIALIALSAGIFFALSAFYVFPMLEQLSFGTLRLNDGTADTIWGTLARRAMPLYKTISDFNLTTANDPWIPNGIGLAIPLSVGVLIYLLIKKVRVSDKAVLCSTLAVIALFASSTLFPWNALQSMLGKLQFPWRLLMFVTFFGAFGAGYTLKSLTKKQLVPVFAACLAAFSVFSYCVTAAPKLKTMINNEIRGVVLEENWHDSLGGAEYLPTGTPWGTMIKNGAVSYTNDTGIRKTLKTTRDFDVTTVSFTGTAADDAYIKIPLVMYKGYEARDQNGALRTLTCERGYVIADIAGLTDGVITVKYVGTAIRTVSQIVSMLTFIGIIIYLILRKTALKRCRRNSPPTADRVSGS